MRRRQEAVQERMFVFSNSYESGPSIVLLHLQRVYSSAFGGSVMQRALLGVLVATAAFFAPAQRPFDSWKSYGGGVDSSQYSSLKQINKTNVKQLQVSWMFPIG